MSTTDGNSTTSPLRRRKSKRFDRSGGSPQATGSTVLDTDDDAADDDVEVDLPETTLEATDPDPVAVETTPDIEEQPEAAAGADEDGFDETSATSTPQESALAVVEEDGNTDPRPDAPGRNRTVDQMTPCGRCGHDVSTVHIEVDGNVLIMESCDNCDTRRWQLAGETVELQQALDHVGEHAGRRR
ncbi:MAG: hypothetical protein OES24_00700 [Acidimicrobiia bacterium]|nr:hypothetical protein [Acidimicrobiia bacterium]